MGKEILMYLCNMLLIAVFIIAPLTCSSKDINSYNFIMDEFPPFNFRDKGGPTGIAVDVLIKMFDILNIPKTKKNIAVLPWSRGYMWTKQRPGSCLFSTSRIQSREVKFKWVGPIIDSPKVLISKISRKIKIKSTSDMKKYKIGTVRDDSAETQLLQKTGLDVALVDRASSPKILIKKLIHGRNDVIAINKYSAKWLLIQEKENPKLYEEIYSINNNHNYYACHISTPDKIVESLQKALEKVKSSKDYKIILGKYLGY